MARRKSLKLSTPSEIRRALSRIANMVLNGELDTKVANALVVTCNAILQAIKMQEGNGSIVIENGGTGMKTNRQYDIQCLLRMAEITGDENKRKQYLEQAEKLIFKNCSKGELEKYLTGEPNEL